MIRHILVVCTGNICRSPMAEALLADELGNHAVDVQSAGIAALVHHPADPLACLVMKERGFDISGHRARQATPALLTQADLILVMDKTHSDWLRARLPQLLGRTHKLGRWSGNADVADPYRKSRPHFEQAFVDICAGVKDWVPRIIAT